MRNLVFLLFVFLLAPALAESPRIVTTDPDGPGPLMAAERVEGRLVIDFKGSPSQHELDLWGGLHDLSPQLVSSVSSHGLSTVDVEEHRLKGLLESLPSDPFVESVCPEYVAYSDSIGHAQDPPDPESGPARGFPNDPRFSEQWHFKMVGATKAWKKASGEGVTVALLGTGVAYKAKGKTKPVEDLAQSQVIPGYDFVNGDDDPVDDHGVGTHVAGTIVQSTHNGVGVAGLAYKSRLLTVKVLDEKGSGSFSKIAAGIRFAADQEANIIAMGFSSSADHELMESAVRYAHSRGCLLICSGGVGGDATPGYPGGYEEVISVGAVGRDKRATNYSNRGVDMVAPGGYQAAAEGILQNTIHRNNRGRGDYLWLAGTNSAAAHVAGAAALVMSTGVTSAEEVRDILFSTASKKRDKEAYGAGLLNADKAVKKAASRSQNSCPIGCLTFLVFGGLLLAGLRAHRAWV